MAIGQPLGFINESDRISGCYTLTGVGSGVAFVGYIVVILDGAVAVAVTN